MADVNANIRIGIDSSSALAQLRTLQSQISQFNNSVVRSNAVAVAAQQGYIRALDAQVSSSGRFITSVRTMESSVDRLGSAFDKGTLSTSQYFRTAMGSTRTFGRFFRREMDQVTELAERRVRALQTQYIALGRDAQGAQRIMAMQPTQLATGYATNLEVAHQRQILFNRALQLGTTNLVNWGKNTQWAGRQLMVGFTVPLTIAAGAAAKFFMDIDKAGVAFRRVYGDFETSSQEAEKNLEAIQNLAKEYTKYGLAVSEIIDLGARAAATGATNEDLLAATEQTLRLATLGQMDYNEALDTTISLQTAFQLNSQELAEATDFLNAVENQTVLTIEDLARAIPRVAPVIKGLGGDVKDLAVFMTALREGGVTAEQGANALKSGLASLINPTNRAQESLSKLGIDINAIVQANRGDLMGTVTAFGEALSTLSEFERQQSLEQVFGKFQYARLGALFNNIARDGSQAATTLELAGAATEDLAELAESELSKVSESVTNQFLGAVERLKAAVAPIGEMFLRAVTPIINAVVMIAEKFNSLPDGIKQAIGLVVAAIGLIAPALLMGIGLIANGIGNGLKAIMVFRNGIRGLIGFLTGSRKSFEYNSIAALESATAMSQLDARTSSLTPKILMQAGAVDTLTRAYGNFAAAASAARAAMPQGFVVPTMPMGGFGASNPIRRNKGGTVPGVGDKDTVPALLTPGETVMNKEASRRFAPFLSAMNSGSLRMLARGTSPGEFAHIGGFEQIRLGNLLRMFDTDQFANSFSQAIQARLRNIASVFGEDIAVNMYRSLGFRASGPTNRALAKQGVSPEAFLKDWDTRDTSRWSDSVRRAGLKMSDVDADLGKLDFHMKKYISSLDKGARVTDRTVQEAYNYARRQFSPTSPVFREFDKLQATAREMRVNISKSQAEARGLAVSPYMTKSGRPSSKSFVQAGSSRIKIGGERLMGATMPGIPIAAIQQQAATASSAALKTTGDVIVKEISTASTKAGKQIGPNVMKGASAASPPPWSINLGRWIGQGVNAGMQQQLRLSSSQLRGAVMLGQGGAASPMAMTQAGASMPLPTAGIVNPQALGGNYINPALANQLNSMGNEAQAAAVQTRSLKEKISAVSGKAAGFGAALTGVTIAASFMDNNIGQIAQQAMPVVFGLQGLSMALPMLMNPVGIAIAAFAAVGAGLWFLNNQMNEVRERGQRLADAMTLSAKTVTQVADFFGTSPIARTRANEEIAERAGIQTEELQQAREFISSDIGKEMSESFTLNLARQGRGAAVKSFANQLAGLMAQGVVDSQQARIIAAGLAESMQIPDISAEVVGQLERVVGPNGENLLESPLTIAGSIIFNEREIVNSITDPIFSSLDAAGMQGRGFEVPFLTDFAKNAMSFFSSDFEKAMEQSILFGKALGNTITNAYDVYNSALAQSEELIKKSQEEEEKLTREIEKRNAQGQDTIKQEEQLRDAKQKTKRLIEESARAEEQALSQISSIQQQATREFIKVNERSVAAGLEVIDGMQQSLREVYDDPQMQLILDNIFSKTAGIEKDIKFNIILGLQSGMLNPAAVDRFFGLINDDVSASTSLSIIINSMGLTQANQFLIDLIGIGDEEIVKFLTIKASEEGVGVIDIDRNIAEAENRIYELTRSIEDMERSGGTSSAFKKRLEEEKAALEEQKTIIRELQQQRFDLMYMTETPETGMASAQELAALEATLTRLADLELRPQIDITGLAESGEDVKAVTDTLKGFADLPTEVLKAIEVESFGFDDVLQLRLQYEGFKSEDPKVIKEAILAAYGDTNLLKAMETGLKEFASAPESFKVAAAMTYTAVVNVEADLRIAGNMLEERVSGQVGMSADRVAELATRVGSLRDRLSTLDSAINSLRSVFGGARGGGGGRSRPSSTSGGGGGGGGGGGTSEKTGAEILKEYMDELKTQKKLLGDIAKRNGEVVSGFAQALRSAGAPEQLIADIVSKGEDGIKMAKELLKNRSKQLLELTKLMFSVNRLAFIESQRSAARNAQSQVAAQRGLLASGFGFDLVSDIVSDQETAAAIAESYRRLQNAEKGVQQATGKSRKERKLANQELKAAQKEWNQLTNAIQRNILEQERLQIQNLTGEAEQRAQESRRRISAALALTGRGFEGEIIDRMIADPAVVNQVSRYVEKLRELEKTRTRLANIKDPTEKQREKLEQIEKQIARTEAQYRRLIRSLRELSQAEKEALVAGAEEGLEAQTRAARREERAANILMGQGGLTYDQATDLARNEDLRDALLIATPEELDVLIEKAKELARVEQEVAWTNRTEELNKEVALQSRRAELIQAAGGDQLKLNYLTSMSYEDILHFLSLSKEEQNGFLDLLERSFTAAEKIANAFDQINERQEYSNILLEAQANERFGVMDQYDEEERSLDRQARATQKLIDNAQDQIDAIREINDDLQHTVDLRQREAELLERRVSEYNRGLELIQRQEDDINKYYDDRLDALDKVDEINQRIAERQKNQLSLSQALSEGDIYAAAQAAQQARQSEATFALEESRNALEQARENALKNLVVEVNGELLNREEIERRVLSIEDQIYEINQSLIPLQDEIYQNNLDIYNIQEQTLEPLQNALDSLNDQKNAIADLKREWQDYYDYLTENAVDPVTGIKFKDLETLRRLYEGALRPGVTEEEAFQEAIGMAPQFGITIPDEQALRTAFGIRAPGQEGQDVAPDPEAVDEVTEGYKEMQAEVQKVKDKVKEINDESTNISTNLQENVNPRFKKMKEIADKIKNKVSDIVAIFTAEEFLTRLATIRRRFENISQNSSNIAESSSNISMTIAEFPLEILQQIVENFEKMKEYSSSVLKSIRNIISSLNELDGMVVEYTTIHNVITRTKNEGGGGGGGQGGGNGSGKTSGPTQSYLDAREKVAAETGLSGRPLTEATREYLQSQNKFAGGLILGAGSRDSIPVMASPGEFVIRSAMVDKYGSSMMNKINQGSFEPSFATPRAAANTSRISVNSASSNSSTMYNTYSVNVTAHTNANADDIANKAVMKIREMQNRQIRSSRVY